MAFSLFACKQFLKDYIDDNPNVAFGDEDRDVIASEISRTSMQFTVEKLVRLINSLENEGRLIGRKENKMEQERIRFTQSKQERFKILLDFFNNDFPVKFPHLERIYSDDGLTTLCPPSAIVLMQALTAEPTLKPGLLSDRIHSLDLNDLLVRKGRIVEVPVEKKPTAQEVARAKKEKFEREAAAGFHQERKNQRTELDDEWNRGKAKPLPLTEPQIQALNARNGEINSILGETLSAINNYSAGRNHARTQDRRGEMTALFNQHRIKINSVAMAKNLAETIKTKMNSYDRGSSTGIS
jgi:hypothetical protein